MIWGFILGVLACAIWGLIYIFPLILPNYHPIVIASARFAVYGLTCMALIPLQKEELKQLSRADWWTALRLAFLALLFITVVWSLVSNCLVLQSAAC